MNTDNEREITYRKRRGDGERKRKDNKRMAEMIDSLRRPFISTVVRGIIKECE